jgi:hypothetical protein
VNCGRKLIWWVGGTLTLCVVLKIAVSGSYYSLQPVLINESDRTVDIRLVAKTTRRVHEDFARVPVGKSVTIDSLRFGEPEFPVVMEIWSVPNGVLLERRTVPRGDFTTEVIF